MTHIDFAYSNSPVNLRFYLKLIAKEFMSTVISSGHKHIQHIKSLENLKRGKVRILQNKICKNVNK